MIMAIRMLTSTRGMTITILMPTITTTTTMITIMITIMRMTMPIQTTQK